jgi:hypothetical protein
VVALEHCREDSGQFAGTHVEFERRQHILELGFETDIPRCPDGACSHRLGEVAGHGLVRLVLQQTSEEEVTGLEQFEVEDLFALFVRQQPGDLEVEQRGGDEEELRDLREVRLLLEFGGVGDELVGDFGQGDLRDVEATLRDQTEQQVERSGEVLQLDLEPLLRFAVGRGLTFMNSGIAQGAPPRAMSSRASRR